MLLPGADEHLARLARKLDRNMLLREQRTRLLLAVRQTYNDYFQDHYISTGQIYRLRVGEPALVEDSIKQVRGLRNGTFGRMQVTSNLCDLLCRSLQTGGWRMLARA